jgi:hypothetical protein
MGIEIRYGRQVGKVTLDDQGNVAVDISDDEVRHYITDLLANPVTIFKPFRDPRIPGRIMEERRVCTDEVIGQVLIEHEKESYCWVQTPGRDVHENPWFDLEGYCLLKWNQSDAYPWFVVEHKATGFQAFYHGGLRGKASVYYQWFTTPITQSGLVDDWVEFEEEFDTLEEIPYF